MPKLASIRKITSIQPIEELKNIELAHIDSLQVYINIGEFRSCELAVYIAPSSQYD